jgi:hypothetical protein
MITLENLHPHTVSFIHALEDVKMPLSLLPVQKSDHRPRKAKVACTTCQLRRCVDRYRFETLEPGYPQNLKASPRQNARTIVMPTELVFIGGILVVVAGALTFLVINRHKPAEPPHFR